MAKTDPVVELRAIYEELETAVLGLASLTLSGPVTILENSAVDVGKAWSGSWLGYHANVYYEGLIVAPPGAHFDAMRGRGPLSDTRGQWREFASAEVDRAI